MVRPKVPGNGVDKYLKAAIGHIRYNKQVANLERIARYMLGHHDMHALTVEKELHNAVKAGSIVRYMAVSKKGANVGMQQEAYLLPSSAKRGFRKGKIHKNKRRGRPKKLRAQSDILKEPFVKYEKVVHEDSDHDWYCFECQKGELLVQCAECWRSWHCDCTDIDVTDPEKFVCAICLEVEGDLQKVPSLGRKYVNTLLAYSLQRLKDKARELYHLPPKALHERWNDVVFSPIDLSTMANKTQNRKYSCTEEFVADAKTVAHNVILTCGAGSPMALLAVTMLNDCMYEVDEIRQCHDCYYMSNSKPPDWFCQPCYPNHELVYAKQTGFSYWPAKVIYKLDEDKYDVRFFGGYHQRAVVPKKCIQPITTNITEIAVKRTAGFNKACGELEKHRQLLSKNVRSQYAFVNDSDNELSDDKDDVDTLTVSSTSKVKASVVKSPVCEDRNQVTSTEDQVPAKKRKLTETSAIATQTKEVKLSNKSPQTDVKMGDRWCNCDITVKQSGDAPLPTAQAATLPTASTAILITDSSDKSDKTVTQQSKIKAEVPSSQDIKAKLQKDFEEDKQQAVSRATANMQQELEKARKQTEEKCKEIHAEELKKLQAKHKEMVTVIKHKQWCYNCEAEAMYHCCWNTSYCSIKCQQDHWHKEHKRVCRRKR